MEKRLLKLVLITGFLVCVYLSSSAQIYVKIRPVVPVVVVTTRPSPAHIWIGEEWREDGGNYRYSGGFWGTPPHPGDQWYAGHWNHHRRHGDRWVSGSWRGKDERRR